MAVGGGGGRRGNKQSKPQITGCWVHCVQAWSGSGEALACSTTKQEHRKTNSRLLSPCEQHTANDHLQKVTGGCAHGFPVRTNDAYQQQPQSCHNLHLYGRYSPLPPFIPERALASGRCARRRKQTRSRSECRGEQTVEEGSEVTAARRSFSLPPQPPVNQRLSRVLGGAAGPKHSTEHKRQFGHVP